MSASILIAHDPEGINNREITEVETGSKLMDFLIKKYGESGFDVPTQIYSGVICEENLIKLNEHMVDGYILKEGEIITIAHRPLDPLTIVTVIVAVLAFVLAPDISPPPVPENPSFPKTNESPNNRLVGQTNLARPLGRIPDIYGRMRVYPDLGTQTVTEFINHIKFVTEYLIIGRGEYVIEDLKSGETLLDNIAGSDSTIYNPNDLIPELIRAITSNEVNGQEIKGSNDNGSFDTSTQDDVVFSPSNFKSVDTGLSNFSQLTAGDAFTVSGSTNSDGTYTFISLSTKVFPPEPPDFDGVTTYIVRVEEVIPSGSGVQLITYSGTNKSDIIGPFVVPSELNEEAWFDITAPRGLSDRRLGAEDSVSIIFDLILEEIDSNDAVINTETTRVTITDQTLNARFYTFKIPLSNISAGVRYQATVQRISTTINDSAYYDVTKWAGLSGITKLIDFDQGNVTSVVLITQATDQATKNQERKFNAIVTRKLRSYIVGAGFQPVQATTKMADALLEHLTNSFIGGKPDADIDLDELYTIQEALDVDPFYGSVIGRFSYSFSDTKAAVVDELLTIANACRVFINRIGNRLEFGRDEIRDSRTTLFNTRNKKPRSEKKNIRLQKPSDFDGIELQWIWEDSGEPFTILLPEVGALNRKRIEAAGIRNFKQAWNRASIELAKLSLQRTVLEFTSTKEGLLARVGDRIANADGTDIKTQSGEIKGFDVTNLIIETYNAIDFKGNPNANVTMRDESGNVSEFIATPRLDGVSGFILDIAPVFTLRVRGDLKYQVGTLYAFALIGEAKIVDYVIQKIDPTRDNYVKISASIYKSEIYAADSEFAPPHPTTLSTIFPDQVTGGEFIDPTLSLSAPAAETLAWNPAPSGTVSAVSQAGKALGAIRVDTLGAWSATATGDQSSGAQSGLYRPQVIGSDEINYEVKFTLSTSGVVSVNAAGGALLNTWHPLGETMGYNLSSNGIGDATFTKDIREILNPANTTGPATITIDLSGTDPL